MEPTARPPARDARKAPREGTIASPPPPARVDDAAGRNVPLKLVRPGMPPSGGAYAEGGIRERASTIVAADSAFLAALDTALRVADSMAAVLLCGETGTGKELLARAIHEFSGRAGEPFVPVNCAAVPEPLLESELFGHERGAFTGAERQRVGRFERASGGTLFLDEVGDMSPALQAKILRALETREIERVGGDAPIPVDVRLIAATNRRLKADMACGRFREDLYYRLAGIVIWLPPLRERPADLRPLLRHYLALYACQYGIHCPFREGPGSCGQGCENCWLSKEACERLREHTWPGNIRELKNVMERLALLAGSGKILPEHLPPELRRADEPAQDEPEDGTPWRPRTMRENERRHIARILALTGGNKSRAAEMLGIHRNTLRTKMRQHGLS